MLHTETATLPEITTNDYEIERGKPMPSLNHSIVQTNLVAEFLFAYRSKYRVLSEISLKLADWPSTPDIGIFPKIPINFQHDKIQLEDAPLGVVEIVSPSQSVQELYEKVEKYFAHGVKSAWLIIPTLKTVVVYSSPENYQMFTTGDVVDAILDIKVAHDKIFEED